MKKLAIGTLSVVASVALAASGTMESTSTGDQPIKILANVDLNMASLKMGGDAGSTNLGANLDFGVAGDYFFTEELGAGLGLTWDMLSGSKTIDGTKFKASNNYLDIPINFLYNWQASSTVSSIFGIGPYIGLPLAKWNINIGGPSYKVSAKTAFGLNLENNTTWQISDQFALGGHIFFKWDFADTMNEPTATFDTGKYNQTYYAFGIGASAKFL